MGMSTSATPALEVIAPVLANMTEDDHEAEKHRLQHQHQSRACFTAGPGRTPTRRRYALLMAVRDSDYVRDKYGGYYNVFVAAFGDGKGEDQWDMYRVVDGEFPRTEDLGLYEGFVITGSPNDAYGDDKWVRQLRKLVSDLFSKTQKRVLGVCFGHQLICQALGGEVNKARRGWDMGVTDVVVAVPESSPCWFLEEVLAAYGGGESHRAPILQVHQDEVWKLPPGAEVIGQSERTAVEMFHVDGRMLGIQGHPEYSKEILYEVIGRLVCRGDVEVIKADDARRRLAAGEPDRQFWLGLCRSFLAGPQPQAKHSGGAAPHTTT